MWVEVVVGILLILALLQSALLLYAWRQLRQLQQRVVVQSQEAAYARTDVPTSMLVTALGRLERQMGRLEQQQPAQVRQSYELAQQLARQGADLEQLVSRCGLSRDEARLVLQMHPVNS